MSSNKYKIEYTNIHVFSVQAINTLHTFSDLERNQLLTILAMSVQNPNFAGFLLTGNRSKFLYVEGSTAWLYDWPHFLPSLYKAGRIHFKDTLMYVDPITRQNYDYATPIACDNNPKNILIPHFGKAHSQSFISSNTPNYDANSPHENPYNTVRVGLHDKLKNLTTLLTPTWFSDAFIALFHSLTQCGIYFSTFLFVQAIFTLIVKLNKTISKKYNPKQNITFSSSIADCFFKILTAGMVNGLNHTHQKKTTLALPTSKSQENVSDTLNHFSDNQTPSINYTNGITS